MYLSIFNAHNGRKRASYNSSTLIALHYIENSLNHTPRLIYIRTFTISCTISYLHCVSTADGEKKSSRKK